MMKKKWYLAGLKLALIVSSLALVWDGAAQENSPAHVGFIYPISTQGLQASAFTNALSIHALAGISGGERGFAVYGLAGRIQGNATGMQAAGLWLSIAGELNGFQLAGLLNQTSDGGKGMQAAGILNSTKRLSGVQLGGIWNIASASNGFQAAGIGNFAPNVTGVQLAGIVNHADEVNGLQISGILNKAGTVKGVQLSGLINIADSSDYPIGIINLIATGEKRIGYAVDENLTQLVSFRSGGKKMYGIIGIGSNLKYDQLPYAMEAGIGIKVWERRRFRLDMEASNLVATNFKRWGGYYRSGVRVLPVLALTKNLQVYAGPSLNYMHTRSGEGDELARLTIWDRQRSSGYKAVHWGLHGGIQVILN